MGTKWWLSGALGALVLFTGPLLAAEPPAGAGQAVAAARAWRAAHGARSSAASPSCCAHPNVASDQPAIEENAQLIARGLQAPGASGRALGAVPDAPPVVFGSSTRPGRSARSASTSTTTASRSTRRGGPRLDRGSRRSTPRRSTPAAWRARCRLPGEAIDPEWRLYARSAGDDKAPLAAILAALDALAAAGVPRTANLRFFFEGEEEAGSPHLGDIMRAARARRSAPSTAG